LSACIVFAKLAAECPCLTTSISFLPYILLNPVYTGFLNQLILFHMMHVWIPIHLNLDPINTYSHLNWS